MKIALEFMDMGTLKDIKQNAMKKDQDGILMKENRPLIPEPVMSKIF